MSGTGIFKSSQAVAQIIAGGIMGAAIAGERNLDISIRRTMYNVSVNGDMVIC